MRLSLAPTLHVPDSAPAETRRPLAWVARRVAAAAIITHAACLHGCAPASPSAESPGPAADLPVIRPVYMSVRDTAENIDSPAVWHGSAGQHWVLVTAKEGDRVQVLDATTGVLQRRVGRSGSGAGEMRRPNGVVVLDDLMMVVERDNGRVQVFSLPGFDPLGTFGEADLRLPYGIAARRSGPGRYVAWVTDSWESSEGVIPPDSLLDDRVREYDVTVDGGRVGARNTRSFGATSGRGVLHVVESIALDPDRGRLLIAEEEEGDSRVLVYGTGGAFTGQEIPTTFFPHQAEGIALYPCSNDGGFWITTDQGEEMNTFHLFDRATLRHLGSFRGEGVLNTDGIAVTEVSFPGFLGGAFFAIHDDGNVAAFRWTDIARALLLPTCSAPARAASP